MAPPSGPKALRASTYTTSSRTPRRGGIQKKTNTAPRIDRDGDLVMGAASATSQVGGSGRGGLARNAKLDPAQTTRTRTSSRLARGGIDHTVMQRNILRGMGSTAPLPKGPRKSLGSVRGRGHGREAREALQEISVVGLKQSKAAGNSDGGVRDLIDFLERKSTNYDVHAQEAVKIKKSRLEGENLIVSVRPRDSQKIIHLHNYQFAGAELSIKLLTQDASSSRPFSVDSKSESEKQSTIDALKAVIQSRYDPTSKFLDLSRLGSDPKLIGMGMFEKTSTGSKLFPALMKIIDAESPDARSKEGTIVSASLADNDLTSVSPVASLSQTLPALKNLDLSKNRLENLSALELWRGKLPKLEHLILSGNPMEVQMASYKDDLLRWFPFLTTIDSDQIRTLENIKAAAKGKLPIPTLNPSFRDEGSIGNTFIQTFFPSYDSDRSNLVSNYYDADSTFSLSINTSAPRAFDKAGEQVPGWSSYIKRSRNLMKLNQLPARMHRLYTGLEQIREAFTTLPATRHPSLATESQKWCIECHAIPGLPDATGQSASGVGGLMVMAHGEFSEINIATNESIATRSFDRTFILGPGAGPSGLRVLKDILVLRSHGGHEAWQPDDSEQQQRTHQITVPEGFAVPEPGKPLEQVQKEAAVVELSKGTGLTLEFAEMCLDQSNWNLQHAMMSFEQAMATEEGIPPECFVPR